MNESIGDDHTEGIEKREGYLEDEEGTSHGYDYDAELDDHHGYQLDNHKVTAIQHTINKGKKKAKQIEETQEEEPYNDRSSTLNVEDSMNISLVFFCVVDLSPLSFLKTVLFIKILDILFYYFMFGRSFIIIQCIMTVMFSWMECRLVFRIIGSKYIKGVYMCMILSSIYFVCMFLSSIFAINPRDENNSLIYMRVIIFMVWIMQNIAWVFQIIDSTEVLVSTSSVPLHVSAPRPHIHNKSLEDSFNNDPPALQSHTKAKLKKRQSSSFDNNDSNNI